MGRAETAAWLADAHKQRQAAGKASASRIRNEVGKLRAAGRAADADRAARQLSRQSISSQRRQRRAQIEGERNARRVGAAIRRSERERKRVAGSFPAFTKALPKPPARAARDLYFEWISRGFASGRARAYGGKGKPRIAARATGWRDAEFADKIVYIEREDALEEVDGATISNMGESQAERMGCAERIEELEKLGRSDANVYVHTILAMPHQLSPEGRVELMRELTGHLARRNLPFAAALHKPDPKHDPRNFHLHIVESLRPMIVKGDRWEFAATKLTWLSSPPGLRLQRRVISDAFNRALAREGYAVRWTDRSRAKDGLAPGGFTKRAGVSFEHGPTAEELESAVAVANVRQEQLEAIDLALTEMDDVATRLETIDRAVTRIEAGLGNDAGEIMAGIERIATSQSANKAEPSHSAEIATGATQPPLQPDSRDEGWVSERSNVPVASSQAKTEEDRVSSSLEPPASSQDQPMQNADAPSRRRRRKPLASPDRSGKGHGGPRGGATKFTLEQIEAMARSAVARFHRAPEYAALALAERKAIDVDIERLVVKVVLGDLRLSFDEGLKVAVCTDDALNLARGCGADRLRWRVMRTMADALAALPRPEQGYMWESLPLPPPENDVVHQYSRGQGRSR